MHLAPQHLYHKLNKYLVAIYAVFSGILYLAVFPSLTFAATSNADITNYTNSTLQIITAIATSAAVLFLVKGGYQYITSTGKPDAVADAKKTIKNALIGLVLVLGASLLVNILTSSLAGSTGTDTTSTISIVPLTPSTPSNGLAQVLIDAISAVMQNLVSSATQPIVNALIGYLTTTPSVLHNATISQFWLVMLGITDSLFVLVVALLGLHLMSASTFGFDEVELKQLLPRLGLAFLGANISLFLADYVIVTCNALTSTVLNSTGGLAHAWIINAITLPNLIQGNIPLITLVFFILFLILAIVLLFMYISRLIMISLGAVLSPFIFLLWAIPKFSDFAEIAIKTYVVTVFTVFVHVVVIQLASSFLSLPDHQDSSLLSIAVAIGLFFTLLKIPHTLMHMVTYTTKNGTFKKLGSQIINVITTSSQSPVESVSATPRTNPDVKLPRKVIQA